MEASTPEHELDLIRRLLSLTPRLRGFLSQRIPPRHRASIDPDDLLQEVHVAALAGAPDCIFREESEFEAWVFTIARRKLIDEIRAQTAMKRGAGTVFHAGQLESNPESLAAALTSMSGGPTPSRDAAGRELREEVLKGIARLPEPQQSALRLHHFEGLGVQEVAESLGLTPGQARSSLYRGRCRLAEIMGRAARFFSDAPSSQRVEVLSPARQSSSASEVLP